MVTKQYHDIKARQLASSTGKPPVRLGVNTGVAGEHEWIYLAIYIHRYMSIYVRACMCVYTYIYIYPDSWSLPGQPSG